MKIKHNPLTPQSHIKDLLCITEHETYHSWLLAQLNPETPADIIALYGLRILLDVSCKQCIKKQFYTQTYANYL